MMTPRGTPRARALLVLLGLVAALVAGLGATAAGLPRDAAWTAAITCLCALWWATEPISLPATALIPFALLPMTGVMDHKQVASAYGHPIVLLLLSGFVLSRLLETCGAHRRLAVMMVRWIGGRSSRGLVLGFMVASAALSMWIANTAVALMMLPIAAAVYERDERGQLAAPLLLGICYATNIGGLGTPIGTPPLPVFMAAYEDATGTTLGFIDWMRVGVPLVVVLVPIAWWIVTRKLDEGAHVELDPPAPWTRRERAVLVLFALTSLAWITREEPSGGWSALLGLVDARGVSTAGDGTVGLLFVLLAFFIPDGEDGRLLEWDTVESIPWGLLVLVGGGVALARAFTSSGLSASIGAAAAGGSGWPLPVLLFVLVLVVSLMTELTSNTATATLLMPILAGAAGALALAPASLMIPAVIACGCAFMLPVATGPNAIVYGSGRLSVARMATAGLALNLIAVVIVTLLGLWWVPFVLDL